MTSSACPICKKKVESSGSDFPFCSERCREIDLGNWASETYRVAAPVSESEEELPDFETGDDESRNR